MAGVSAGANPPLINGVASESDEVLVLDVDSVAEEVAEDSVVEVTVTESVAVVDTSEVERESVVEVGSAAMETAEAESELVEVRVDVELDADVETKAVEEVSFKSVVLCVSVTEEVVALLPCVCRARSCLAARM